MRTVVSGIMGALGSLRGVPSPGNDSVPETCTSGESGDSQINFFSQVLSHAFEKCFLSCWTSVSCHPLTQTCSDVRNYVDKPHGLKNNEIRKQSQSDF